MGRLNKKLQKGPIKTKLENSSRISKSDVLKTLANNDKKETDTRQIKVDKHVAQKTKKQLPKTLEELDSHPDFQLLLLDKNTAIQQLAQRSNENNRNSNNSSLENAKKKIKKKEKMKIRKELLEKKIHVIKLLKQEEKAMKKRKQTVVTGDLKPMADTLNQVIQDEIKPKLNVTSISQKSERKNKGFPKQKKVKASFMEGMSVFKQVNSHEQYIKNPFGTISTHIENKMLIESMQQE